MDVSNPMSSVVPGGRGSVLAVLARAGIPLSGRQIAGLTAEAVSVARTAKILTELARAGIVVAEPRPPAILYSLNDDHLAAAAIRQLCSMSMTLIENMRAEIATWAIAPTGAWLFGSAARRDGDLDSDIDVLLLQPAVVGDEAVWEEQILLLAESIFRWTGNPGSVVDYSEAEIVQLTDAGEDLPEAIRRDGVHLAGRRHLVERSVVRAS